MKSRVGVPLEGLAEYSRYAATQGVTLLKNENAFLPLSKEDRVAVFGRCQIDYYRTGTGSGGAVNVSYTTNFISSLRKEQPENINEEIAKIYEEWVKENPFDNGGGGWTAEPWNQEEMPVTEELVKRARKTSRKAIIIIGRTAGEDKDNADQLGSYRLTNEEINMIDRVAEEFDDLGLVMNVSNIIDMSWVQDYEDKIKAIVYVWHGGMEGGNAAIDVMIGKESPSGKLPDTIAYDIQDYPSTKNHGGVKENIYQEDIYVGYRYFETFAPHRVQYPFGFGLSYTQFSIEHTKGVVLGNGVGDKQGGVSISATVKNIGDMYVGKEVIQVYVEAPQGKLGKPARELVGFVKSKALQPGETQEVSIFISWERLSSYDDSGITGNKSAYVLEEGAYTFYIGNSVRAKDIVKIDDKNALYVQSLVVINQLEQALAPTKAFKRIKPMPCKDGEIYDITYEEVPMQAICLKERIQANKPEGVAMTGDKNIKLKDVKEGKATMRAFIAQLDEEDLSAIVRGEGMSHPEVTPGTASAFGGVTGKLKYYGIPLICTADGPSGVRMEGGLKATQLPIGTLLAATWDIDLIEQLYAMEGQEIVGNCVDVLLGPGLNIHRNPLNGRNFEYYSEDPLLTGQMASAVIKGLRKGGAIGTLKHFACNSQETYRHDVDAIISERAAREIYLKGFEIAVKEGEASSIMTAYNPLNGHWTASNYDLNTTILRKEWGFKGIVMTDWWAKMNDTVEGGKGTRQNTQAMVQAQNDIYMVIGNYAAEYNEYGDNTIESLHLGKLSIGELQRCAMNICQFALTTKSIDRDPMLFGSVEVFEAVKDGDTKVVYGDDAAITITEFTGEPFTFKGAGLYQVKITYSSATEGLGQASCNIRLNDKIMAVVQVGTTNNEQITKKIADVEMQQGNYTISVESTSTELRIYQIIFNKINSEQAN